MNSCYIICITCCTRNTNLIFKIYVTINRHPLCSTEDCKTVIVNDHRGSRTQGFLCNRKYSIIFYFSHRQKFIFRNLTKGVAHALLFPSCKKTEGRSDHVALRARNKFTDSNQISVLNKEVIKVKSAIGWQGTLWWTGCVPSP